VGIIVASSNLFRLELSAYLLSEAGYIVHEARDAEALLHELEHSVPSLIVLDKQLDGSQPALLDKLLQRAGARVLVIGDVRPTDLQALQARGGDTIGWPYQNEDLLARAAALQRASEPFQNIMGA
jgi:DNA-binding response OmpR family regulator